MGLIHATAIVDPRARLAAGVAVGPYTVIDGDVEVGEGTTIGAHCVLEGHTTIGRDNRIFQFNSLGAIPQDKKYAGEPCELVPPLPFIIDSTYVSGWSPAVVGSVSRAPK